MIVIFSADRERYVWMVPASVAIQQAKNQVLYADPAMHVAVTLQFVWQQMTPCVPVVLHGVLPVSHVVSQEMKRAVFP